MRSVEQRGFPSLMMGKRFADPFHDPESWKGKIEGVKGGIRDKPNLRMQNRSMRYLSLAYSSVESSQEDFLSTFISRYINVSGRNYTPSRAAHSLIHSAIIIALPPRPSIPAFAPSQGKRVLLIS